MNKLFKLIPHILFILSAMFTVFLILDNFNPVMQFVSNDISRGLLWIFCPLSFIYSIYSICRKR